MQHTAVSTRLGEIWFSYEPLSQGPAILLIHGAMRSANDLFRFGSAFTNIVYAHLPNHGVPPISSVSVDDWSKAFAVASSVFFQGRTFIIGGESLGGLVAIGMSRFFNPRACSVVAFDPPLSKMPWPLSKAELDAEIRLLFENEYWWMLEGANIPVHIVAGLDPLEPPRATRRIPSLLSSSDRIRASKLSTLYEVPGGHLLLEESADSCRRILSDLMQHVD